MARAPRCRSSRNGICGTRACPADKAGDEEEEKSEPKKKHKIAGFKKLCTEPRKDGGHFAGLGAEAAVRLQLTGLLNDWQPRQGGAF